MATENILREIGSPQGTPVKLMNLAQLQSKRSSIVNKLNAILTPTSAAAEVDKVSVLMDVDTENDEVPPPI